MKSSGRIRNISIKGMIRKKYGKSNFLKNNVKKLYEKFYYDYYICLF